MNSIKGLMTTKEVNEALLNASRKMVQEEDGCVNVPVQNLKEVLVKLLEQAQVMAETLAKSGDENAAWLDKKLHELSEEFDVMELSLQEEQEYLGDMGERLELEEAINAGATVFGGDVANNTDNKEHLS